MKKVFFAGLTVKLNVRGYWKSYLLYTILYSKKEKDFGVTEDFENRLV